MSFNKITYHATGELKTEMNIVDGQVHGPVRNYWPNGNLAHTSTYNMGCPEGEITEYDENGDVIRTSIWNDPADGPPPIED